MKSLPSHPYFFPFLVLALGLVSLKASAQNSLFDDSQVNTVYIEIPPDSLNWIMDNVLSDHYVKARFIFDYSSGRDTLENIGFRLRGNTSRFSQKKSFKLSFNEYAQGRKYQGVKKINLNGQHNDPTLIREKLFYDTWKNLGMAERRTNFVRLYINNSYYGLYTNLEEFDKDWLQRVYPENSGNLYKCTYPATLEYINDNQQSYKDLLNTTATGGRVYELQTNETTDDYSDLVALITLLDHPENPAFVSQLSNLLDIDETLKAFALDVATGNWDDYMYNKNNYFLYHNLATGKFEYITYDTDNTFGVDWMNEDWATRDCKQWLMLSEPRPLATGLLNVPALKAKYEQYLDTIVRRFTLPDSIFPHIDSLRNLISSAAEADTYRTLDWGYSVSDFYNGYDQTIDQHTPYGIKPFLLLRRSKILEQLHPQSISESDANTGFSVWPNPASDRITIYSTLNVDEIRYELSDIQGRKWLRGKLKKGEANISLQKLPAGNYVLKLLSNDHQQSKILVKQ
ncbi:MAG: CotH kinase family protein [Bacteroidetes bacterium]|nr:CotH kinase family protein [Bacteroidota bacterium]